MMIVDLQSSSRMILPCLHLVCSHDAEMAASMIGRRFVLKIFKLSANAANAEYDQISRPIVAPIVMKPAYAPIFTSENRNRLFSYFAFFWLRLDSNLEPLRL